MAMVLGKTDGLVGRKTRNKVILSKLPAQELDTENPARQKLYSLCPKMHLNTTRNTHNRAFVKFLCDRALSFKNLASFLK